MKKKSPRADQANLIKQATPKSRKRNRRDEISRKKTCWPPELYLASIARFGRLPAP